MNSLTSKGIENTLIDDILEELSIGRPIILSDDKDRENEGDIVYIADKVSHKSLAFMMEHGKGLICMSISEERRLELNLPFQVQQNESMFGTNFATPFNHHSVHSNGITASSRTRTILEASREQVKSADFVQPGFIVPVVGRPGGVLERRGQTEGSLDLARLAGSYPAGVICEVMNSLGQMLRGEALDAFCKEHSLLSCTVNDLVEYRKSLETSIRLIEEKRVPLSSLIRPGIDLVNLNPNVPIFVRVYYDDVDGMEHFAICVGDNKDGTLVRVHSECLTGDVFGSLRCDCGTQFDTALLTMLSREEGVLIYLQQEGRGIGLANKLKAYELQEQGYDTVDANLHLGLPADGRDYRVAAEILKGMKISKVQVLTNNPLKIEALRESGITVEGRIPIESSPREENRAYLSTKKLRMGHLLSFEDE